MTKIGETEVKKAESLIGVIPMNEHIIVKMPHIEKKTKGGIIKSDKILEEEKKKLPRYVEVVAVAQNSEFSIGEYVRPAPDAGYVRIEEDGENYGIISSFAIIAKLSEDKKKEHIAAVKEVELKETVSQGISAKLGFEV